MCKTFCDFKQVYLHAQCNSTLTFWWPYKKWLHVVNIINVTIYIHDVVHEILYGQHLMKWIINVEITCSLKNSILFLTP